MGIGTSIWDAISGQGDTSPLTGEQANADAAAKAYAAQQAALGGTPYAIDPTQAAQSRAQQEQAITALQGAATGAAPSAAAIQLKQQADTNNANAFGAAAALKGRTPGASFTTAARQNSANQLQTNANAAALRATEMANARAALSGVVGTQEQQDQQGAQAAAQLKTNYAANQEQGQLQSQGQGVTAAGDTVGANVKNSQAESGFIGNAANSIGGELASLSDKNAKKNIKPVKAELDATFEALSPKTFEYKNPAAPGAGPGERVGIIAQDMAKTPLGKDVVIDGSPMKLDMGNALGLALAGIASMRKELDTLKSKKAR